MDTSWCIRIRMPFRHIPHNATFTGAWIFAPIHLTSHLKPASLLFFARKRGGSAAALASRCKGVAHFQLSGVKKKQEVAKCAAKAEIDIVGESMI